MTWTVEFQPQKEQIGTLVVSFAGALPADAWEYQFSVDFSLVKDLAGYAEKARALKAEADANKAKTPAYQALLDGLAAELNTGGK